MPIHVVYLSHGGKKYHDQTRFSVLTLLHFLLQQSRHDVRIAIYTDAPAQMPQHPLIQTLTVTSAELRAYRGCFDYVHRIKLKVLQRASRELGLPLLYVDCDTRWQSLPDDIFARLQSAEAEAEPVCCMHVHEGWFGADFFPDYQRASQQLRLPLQALGVADTSRLAMWNAGAIGVPLGATDFFERVLAVNDYLLPRVKPRNWVEQFALSLVACHRYQMLALDSHLHHYWNYSYEAPIYLAELFAGLAADAPVEEQARYCATLPWQESRLKQIQAAPEHKRQRRRNKLRNSVSKRKIDLKIFFSQLGLRLAGKY